VFVIKKKSGKWRLLIDLRNVNASMVSMGALQTGLPTPACIPKDWSLIVLDFTRLLLYYYLHIPKIGKVLHFPFLG
jgi:hypothetical protein